MFGHTGPFPSYIMTHDETLTIRRFNGSLDDPAGIQIVDGKRVLGEFTEYVIKANVQPVGGDDFVQDPEGNRPVDQLTMYVWRTSELPMAADFVLRGNWYLVMAAENWGSFCRARLQGIDVGPYRPLGF